MSIACLLFSCAFITPIRCACGFLDSIVGICRKMETEMADFAHRAALSSELDIIEDSRNMISATIT